MGRPIRVFGMLGPAPPYYYYYLHLSRLLVRTHLCEAAADNANHFTTNMIILWLPY
jgi:hypothetical protein